MQCTVNLSHSNKLKGPPIIMRRGRTIRHPLYYETKGSLDDGYAEMRVIYMLLSAYIMRRAGIIMRRGAGRYLLIFDIPFVGFILLL